jgi:hypothetical protein
MPNLIDDTNNSRDSIHDVSPSTSRPRDMNDVICFGYTIQTWIHAAEQDPDYNQRQRQRIAAWKHKLTSLTGLYDFCGDICARWNRFRQPPDTLIPFFTSCRLHDRLQECAWMCPPTEWLGIEGVCQRLCIPLQQWKHPLTSNPALQRIMPPSQDMRVEQDEDADEDEECKTWNVADHCYACVLPQDHMDLLQSVSIWDCPDMPLSNSADSVELCIGIRMSDSAKQGIMSTRHGDLNQLMHWLPIQRHRIVASQGAYRPNNPILWSSLATPTMRCNLGAPTLRKWPIMVKVYYHPACQIPVSHRKIWLQGIYANPNATLVQCIETWRHQFCIPI